ncbi:MAG: hypothetical protein IJV83_02390 [Clostridia bacterium]|nr:hypothetical protein [Clostridia bacterium]
MARENKWKTFFKQLNNPPSWVATLTFATALIACPLALATIVMDYGHNVYAIVAYVFCAIILLYTFYVLVQTIRRLHKKVGTVADKFKFTRNLYKSYAFRSIVFATCSSLFNVGYTVFLAVMAIRLRSAWYGALALYHILLVFTLGGVLLRNAADEHKYKDNFTALQRAKVGVYRYCGYMLLIQAVALAISVLEMVVGGTGFRVPKGSLFFFVAFACWRIVASIVHFVRSTKYDLAVRAVRYLNLVTAFVSALTLYTAFFAAFPLNRDVDMAFVNAVAGGCVCAVIVALGGFMIFYSEKVRRKMQAQEQYVKGTLCAGGYNRDGYREEYGETAQISIEEVYNNCNFNKKE